MKKYDDRFQLNTGVIYSNEFMNWIDTKEYRNAILEMENNLQELFERRKIKPLELDPGSPYEEDKLLEYKYLRQRSAMENGPPFTEIFLTGKSEDDSFKLDLVEELSSPTAFVEGPVILDPFDVELDSEQNIVKPVFDDIDHLSEDQINMDNELQTRRQPVLKRFMYEYSTDLILTRAKDSPEVFDFFMGFALRQVKPLVLDQFLDYHFSKNYESKSSEFKRVIDLILRTMNFLFDESTFENLNKAMGNYGEVNISNEPKNNTTSNFDSSNLSNNRRSVIAFEFIFRELGIRQLDKKVQARFIHFITGKNVDNIYKLLRNPLCERVSDSINEYKIVQEEFMKIGHIQLVDRIGIEITKIK
jgi:hypothetical protein